MQRYSTLIQSSYADSKTKQPKIANNKIYIPQEFKSDYFTPNLKKYGVSLTNNKFYSSFSEPLQQIL